MGNAAMDNAATVTEGICEMSEIINLDNIKSFVIPSPTGIIDKADCYSNGCRCNNNGCGCNGNGCNCNTNCCNGQACPSNGCNCNTVCSCEFN